VYARLDLVFGGEDGILFPLDKCVKESLEQIKVYFIGILFIMHINYIGLKLSFYVSIHFIRNIHQRFDPRLLKKNNGVNTFLLKNLE